MKYITINTDASFNHKKQIGGWAFWITAPSWTVKMAGVFKMQPKTSYQCELYALLNALYVLQRKEKNHNFRLIVNTDCKAIVNIINGKFSGRRDKALLKDIKQILLEYDCSVRHIKAHTKALDTPRSYINDWCDKASRQAVHSATGSTKRIGVA